MRAMRCNGFGPADAVFAMVEDHPRPVLRPHDVLVRVVATSVNPVDTKVRSGGYPLERAVPFVLGFDVAGEVVAVGGAATGWSVGDAVIGSPSLARDGANSELVAMDARTVAGKPESLSWAEAAALPLVGLTAAEAVERARVGAGDAVLVNAAAGGVGHVAVQVLAARPAGARPRVLAVAGSDDSEALCKSWGADEVIRHDREDVSTAALWRTDGRGVDAVLQFGPPATATPLFAALRPFGRVVTIVALPDDAPVNALFRLGGAVDYVFMGLATVRPELDPAAQGERLRGVAALVEAGTLRPHVQRTFTLAELPAAHALQEAGRVHGKLVVWVDPPAGTAGRAMA